ncbi:type VII secretion integral membrane protein EccD [Streptomyces sp. NPDC098781]|uniref:type VII secretion integral membrane protein EccD n=1 Tax=Streptomyces sp. NPDC098781 TaxID=3366097 RepID=UPI0038178FE3
MTDNTLAGLCRLSVQTPAKSIDLAVPADIPVAHLLPALLNFGGDDLAESGLEHGGWVLQRLGGEPLDDEISLEAQSLRDGETLFLRPRVETLPEVRLDDLVAGISSTMQDRPYGWSARISRRVLLGLATAALAAGLIVLALPGSPLLRAVAALAGGLLLLGGAASASRAVGDAGAGAALGLMVSPYLALSGWLLPEGELGGADFTVLGSRLLAASAAAAGGAVLALAAVAAFASLFIAVAAVATAGALAGTLMLVWNLPPSHTAGLVALVAVIFGAFVPTLSFRLAGLRMPPLPTNAQQLQEGIEPQSPSVVDERAVHADGWMTGLYGAAGAVCAACLAGLAHDVDLPQVLTVVCLSVLLLLHARGLGNTVQRLSLVAPGVWGVALLVRAGAVHYDQGFRLLMVAELFALTAGITIAAWTVPGRRLVPYWGRLAEILHTTVAIALLPLALWVLGVYGALRAIHT